MPFYRVVIHERRVVSVVVEADDLEDARHMAGSGDGDEEPGNEYVYERNITSAELADDIGDGGYPSEEE